MQSQISTVFVLSNGCHLHAVACCVVCQSFSQIKYLLLLTVSNILVFKEINSVKPLTFNHHAQEAGFTSFPKSLNSIWHVQRSFVSFVRLYLIGCHPKHFLFWFSLDKWSFNKSIVINIPFWNLYNSQKDQWQKAVSAMCVCVLLTFKCVINRCWTLGNVCEINCVPPPHGSTYT